MTRRTATPGAPVAKQPNEPVKVVVRGVRPVDPPVRLAPRLKILHVESARSWLVGELGRTVQVVNERSRLRHTRGSDDALAELSRNLRWLRLLGVHAQVLLPQGSLTPMTCADPRGKGLASRGHSAPQNLRAAYRTLLPEVNALIHERGRASYLGALCRLKPRRQTPRKERPRCGARTRSGRPCLAAPIWLDHMNLPRNGRCGNHGGLSVGPRGQLRDPLDLIAVSKHRRDRDRRRRVFLEIRRAASAADVPDAIGLGSQKAENARLDDVRRAIALEHHWEEKAARREQRRKDWRQRKARRT